MTSGPAVSVIIPCFNLGRFLGQAIDSVRRQSMPDHELIVVNDGSDDSTDALMGEFAHDAKVRYIRQSNQGLPRSRNVGMVMARGRYLQFLDADDFIHQDKFRTEVELLDRNPRLDAVHSDFACVDESGLRRRRKFASPHPATDDFLRDLIVRWERGFCIPIHCFLFRRQALGRAEFDEALPNHEDWDFYIRLAGDGFSSTFHGDVMAFYRMRRGSMSRQRAAMQQGKAAVLARAAQLSPRARELVALRRRRFGITGRSAWRLSSGALARRDRAPN